MSTSLPDLCRSTIVLLDRYQEAREAALKAATGGVPRGIPVADLAEAISDRLHEVGCALPDGSDESKRWCARSTVAWSNVVDPEVWSVELARLAAAAEPAPAGLEEVRHGR